MNDREIFEKFMSWMGMTPTDTKVINDFTVVVYRDELIPDFRFSKRGYDEFYAGAVFDKGGKIVMAYLDSHVAHASHNCIKIEKLLKDE